MQDKWLQVVCLVESIEQHTLYSLELKETESSQLVEILLYLERDLHSQESNSFVFNPQDSLNYFITKSLLRNMYASLVI